MLKKTIFFILLICLPVQLGKHFWPDFSYVLGQRVDYLSPTFYLTDFLILCLFLGEIKKIWRFLKKHLTALLIYGFIILWLSFFWLHFQNQPSALLFYKWLKFFEFVFFIFWVKDNVAINQVLLPLSIGVLGESILAVLEFFRRSSLGFWILGERTFNMNTPGIALANWWGNLALRPYATFSHPNVLAGYTLVVLILNLFSKRNSAFLRILTLVLGTTVIIICFSRTVWLFWLLTVLIWLLKDRKGSFLASLFFLNFKDESFSRRIELMKAAEKMFKDSPIFGVGLGNFISHLPKVLIPQKIYFWQPVHNIFLLILAETGIIGLVVAVYCLLFIIKKLQEKKNLALTISILAVIFTGLFDHYWLTLQQTQLLLSLIIGLCLTKAGRP